MICEGFPIPDVNVLNAMRMQHRHHIIPVMPRHIPPRQAGADPALPVLPDQGPGRDLRVPPYRGPGLRLGNGEFFL